MGRWRKLLDLSRSELWVLTESMVLLPLSALALRTWGLRRVQSMRFGGRRGPGDEDQEQTIARALTVSSMVDAAARRGIWRGNCLQRSIVADMLLRRRGIEPELRIGVRKESAAPEFHAWLEYQGVVLNDRSDIHQLFAPFEKAVPDAASFD